MSAQERLSPEQFREHHLAEMDPGTRASALAQEQVNYSHPKTTFPLETRSGQSNATMVRWLKDAGVPRAEESYVGSAPAHKGASFSGRGPDGEPAVVLHPERWHYGTMAHETAHLIHDHETGRKIGDPAPEGGAHNDRWAGHYARMLTDLEPEAGAEFLSKRSEHLEASGGELGQ
jgi:hypothetical protein